MVDLSDILPRARLLERFGDGVIFEEYGKSELSAIAKTNPEGLHHVAANVWNRIIQKGWHTVNPLQFAGYFRTGNPDLHLAISTLIGEEVIKDIYYVKGWKAHRKNPNLIAEMLVAWVYRNDLQLADITFRDPKQPIPKKARRFALQTHKGLGLLPVLVKSLQKKAEQLHCEQLTLVSARDELVPLFERYGFAVEDSEMGRRGMKLGVGIPRERDV